MKTNAGRRGLLRRLAALLWCLALATVALGQAGCTTFLGEWLHNGFKVGPNYEPPPAPLPPRWIDECHPRVRVGEPNLADWWDVFGDPVLSKLIHQAYEQNLTVRQAGLQILQAQIQRNIACTELLPQAQTALAQYTHGEVSRNHGVAPGAGATFGTALSPSTVVGPLPTPSTPIAGVTMPLTPAGTTTTGTSPLVSGVAAGAGGGVPVGTSRFFNNFGMSLNLAWELDFWGLFRRNLEAADASLDQTMQNHDVIVVQLLANVATQYVEIRTLQKRLELARENVRQQEPLVAKLYQQYMAGIATSKPAYFQLKSNLENTRALIPPLEIALRQANNQLCVLLGIPVRDLLPELGDGRVPDPADPRRLTVRIPRALDDTVVLAIPGDVLLQRPDVLALEQQLRIQTAQIGIAEAELFPHVGLNGSIGLAADRFGKLFNSQSWIGSVGPSLTWNILNYGRLLANVRTQDLQYQQYVLAYQQGILNANQDVENSLVGYLQSLEQSEHLQESANAAVQVTRHYYGQLAQGYLPPAATSLAFYNQIFTAANFQVTQQDVAAQAEGNIALDLILLYRALGGGWQIRLQDMACAAPGSPAPGSLMPVPPPPAPPAEALPMPERVPAPAGAARLGAPVKRPPGS
jgi:NodT family efflux transporter outer membrane factor (OMF) lipoprotein